MLTREIMHLRPVGTHVIQFPRLVLLRHQFPIPDANRTVSFVFPVNRLAIEIVARKGRNEAESLGGLDPMVTHHFGVVGLSKINARRHDVDQMPGLMLDLSTT